MRLYLMRHGEADMAVEDDAGRPLTANGVQQVQRMAAFLKGSSLQIEHILHSGKLRAEHTAQLMAEQLSPDLELQTVSALSGCDGLTPLLKKIDACSEDSLLVSHLPFISRLLSRVLVANADLPIVSFLPATMVCLERCGEDDWRMQWCLSSTLFN